MANRLLTAAFLLAATALAACSAPGSQGTPRPTTKPSSAGPSSAVPSSVSTPVPSPSPEDDGPDAALRAAALKGDLSAATALVRAGADVNAKDATQQSAYLIAASEGHLDLLRLALASGAKVDDLDSYDGTALIRAAERGHFLETGELLRAGIDRDHVNNLGYQAIHEAVWFGKDDQRYATTLRVLVAGGVQLDRPSLNEKLTPLQMAVEKGLAAQAAFLEAIPRHSDIANPNATLLQAAAGGEADLVALALRAGADLEARDDRGRTALLLAVTEDHVHVADLLVAMGASADTLDERHDTPWLVTGVTGSVDMVEALLPANPDLTIKNRYGGISIIPASERGHVDYVRRVVQLDLDVNHVNDLGWTALLEAVILGDGSERYVEIVETLLGAGADPAIADKNGVTALAHAKAKGYTSLVRVLQAAS